MSSVRVVVEWQFGLIKKRWRILHSLQCLRVGHCKIECHFFNGTFLSQLLSLFRGSTHTATYFGLPLPSPEYYLANLRCGGDWNERQPPVPGPDYGYE